MTDIMKNNYKIFSLLFFSFVFSLFFAGLAKAEDYPCCIYQEKKTGAEECVYSDPKLEVPGLELQLNNCEIGKEVNYCPVINDGSKTCAVDYSLGTAKESVSCFADARCFTKLPGFDYGFINWTGDGNVSLSMGETKNISLTAKQKNSADTGAIEFKCAGCESGITMTSGGDTATLIISGALLGVVK